MKRDGGRWAAALIALLGLACAAEEPPAAPQARLSAGRTEFAQLLGRLATLEGTPLGRRAMDVAAALPDCAVIEARSADANLTELLASMRCASEQDELESARDGRDIGFIWPLESGETLRGRLDLDAWDNAELELLIPGGFGEGAAALVLPGETPPGPGVLSHADTLLHARVRPAGGLDLSSLVTADGQASQLFRLQSAIFAGAVLDGTWEAAIYLPHESDSLPPAAVAVGFHSRAAALAAMKQFVAELRETWPITRSDFHLGAAQGECLLDLRILPDFAPCYVATQNALVLGWNAESVARALDAGGERLGSQGGLLIELARFGDADAAIAAAARVPVPALSAPSPWQRIRAVGRREADAVRVHLQLQAEPDA